MRFKQRLQRILSGYSPRQQRKSLVLGFAVGLAVAVFCYFNSDRDWLRFAENLIQRTWMDRYYATYNTQANSQYQDSSADVLDRSFTEKIILVVFDDSSLRSGLRWPISRALYADLVRKLKIAGAKTVAFDIIFSGPSQDPQADRSLQQTFADQAVIVPYGLLGQETSIQKGLLYPPLVDSWPESDKRRRLGFTMEVSDPIDKRVRLAVLKVSPPENIPGSPHYSLTVAALAHYWGITPQEVLDRCAGKYETADITITGSPYAFTATVGRIAYCGSDLSCGSGLDNENSGESEDDLLTARLGSGASKRPQAKLARSNVPPISDYIQVWPVQDILAMPDDELPGLFGVSVDAGSGQETPNRVLALVGVNVPGGYDIKMSDVGSISGVSIHANILWNLMQNTFLKDYSIRYAPIYIISLAICAALLAAFVETKRAGVLFLLLCGGYWYLGYHLMYSHYFSTGGLIIPIFTPWLGALASFSAVTLRNILVERNARQTMHNALADVLPVPDIEDWVNNRGLEIGSEERNLTILFSDIRGYTDLSETLNPVDITEMLNTYHEAMGSIFEHYGGIIFDYQGDAQMVVFGLAPASQPNHAAAAVKAAAAMVLRLDQLRSEWKAQNRPVFECGVGVCTGSVALGVIGSKYRKQICAIGDPTNTSARMQGKSKELNSPVLMTESTFTAAGDDIDAYYIQAVSVKGKREPLNVYGVDFAKMQTRLQQDGLHLDDINAVILVLSFIRRKNQPANLQEQQACGLFKTAVAGSGGRLIAPGTEHSGQIAAVFGWPKDASDNPVLKAYQCAVDFINCYYRETDCPPNSIFVSMHSGLAAVREAGTDQDRQCSVQGEAWHIAQDLNQKCQKLNVGFIATETVLPALKEHGRFKAVSTYKLPHKKQTIAVYAMPDRFPLS